MTSLNKKLIWSALAIAMLTTPALAQHHRPASQEPKALQGPALQYPNSAVKSGSAQNADYGAEFNLGH